MLRRISALVPEGGHVLDLGCGSGRLLAHLARCRPDLRITGLDLSEPMVATGRQLLTGEGLAGRVSLQVADMTALPDAGVVDLVTCVFALHHLPTAELLHRCLRGVAALRRSTGAGVWIYDFARPTRRRTADAFPRIFTPEADAAFIDDTAHSLRAAWTWRELRSAAGVVGSDLTSARGRPLPLFQVHWAPRLLWREPDLPERSRRDARRLAGLFPRRRLP